MMAATEDIFDVVQLLLNNGANVVDKDNVGCVLNVLSCHDCILYFYIFCHLRVETGQK